MTQQILIISDDLSNESLRHAVADHGFQIRVVENAGAGYRLLEEDHFDLVVMDLADTAAVVGLIKQTQSSGALRAVPILTVAQWGTGQATLALAHGANGFEPKPIDADRLVEAIEKLLRPRLAMIARASTTNGEADA
jgi:two-component system, NtrC family, nitrogen regulation response regulator NtrX